MLILGGRAPLTGVEQKPQQGESRQAKEQRAWRVPLRSSLLFDELTATWLTLPHPMQTGREYASAIVASGIA